MGQAQEKTIPKLVIKKVIHAKRAKVFEAWTTPELMQQWFLGVPGWTARTSNDLRVGGKYHHEMIVGPDKTYDQGCATESTRKPGEVILHTGEYLEINPPEKLVFTWNSPFVQDTRVTVELRDLGENTELWLTHELFNTEAARESHNKGWDACLANLEQFFTA